MSETQMQGEDKNSLNTFSKIRTLIITARKYVNL